MIRITLAIACFLLSGCQHLPDTLIGEYSHQDTLPAFFQQGHSVVENASLELRGFYPVKRHYF